MNKINAILVDGNQQLFGVGRVRCLLHFEECRAERCPMENDLEKFNLRIFRRHVSRLRMCTDDLLEQRQRDQR